MTDPLSLLRIYNVNRKSFFERDDQIIFDEVSWPKNIKTNYLTYGTGKDGTPKEYYTLECLVFFLEHVRLTHTMYVREAVARNIPIVRRPDRKDLLAYLNAETATSTAIDKFAPLEIPVKLKRSAQDVLENDITKRPHVQQEMQMQKMKEQLTARLNTPKETTVTLENIKSLSDTMSVEKIAAIKAKRLARKRTTIKETEDITDRSYFDSAMVSIDVDDSRTIFSRERQLRTRSNILQTTGKEFATSVMALLESIKERERNKNKSTNEPMAAPMKMSLVQQQQQRIAYSRYDQERFTRKDVEAGEFNINTVGSFHDKGLDIVTESINLTLMTPLSVNLPLKMPLTVNLSSNTSPSVIPGEPVSIPMPGSLPTVTTQQVVLKKRINTTPIIVVPSSNASLINMLNAKDILQELKFITNEEKRVQGAKREMDILIQRRKENGLSVPYRIIDNVRKLKNEDWDRVVGVFVLGPQWQFKGWPYGGNPVEIFSRICAFHIKYDEMPMDANVARWAVTVIDISKTKRHSDRAAFTKFWEVLDKYLVKNKPKLRF